MTSIPTGWVGEMLDGARFCNAIGLVLNLCGALVAGYALATTWRQYGPGPIFPPLTRAVAVVVSVWHRLVPWTRRSVTVNMSGLAAGVGTGSARVTVRTGFPPSLSVEQKVDALISAYQQLGDELSNNWAETARADAELRARLDETRDAMLSNHARLEAMAREIAVSDVRLQLVALMLVAAGSIFQALPSLICMSVACK